MSALNLSRITFLNAKFADAFIDDQKKLAPLYFKLPPLGKLRGPWPHLAWKSVLNYAQEKGTGALLSYWSQEKETGTILFSGEGNWCTTVLRRMKYVLYSFNFLREGIWWYTVLRRKKLVHYYSQGEGNWCTTVFRRKKQVLYCFQEKGSVAQLFSGEGNWCITVMKHKETGALLLFFFRRRELMLYCSREEGHGAVLYSGERKWCRSKFTC